MTRTLPQPRLSRMGFVPAGPEGRTDRRNMAIPKPGIRSEFIPHLPEASFSWLCAQLGPDERRGFCFVLSRATIGS